mgnify:FL=1
MKRRIIGKLTLCLAVLLLTAGLTGCVGKSLPEGLIGEWTCEKFASDGTTATDFYALYIEKNGKFSLYDTVGNPGISGKMTLKSTEEDAVMGTVTVSCNSDDFDPPLCWDMQESDELEYEIPEDGRMRLGYNGIWLSFYEDNTYEVYKIRLADRSAPEYQWELLQSGDGAVNFTTEMLEDEDVGIWRIYDFYAEKAGNVLVTMNYRNKDTVMYTVSFDLAVNDNGTIHENGIGGDVDDAMTS